MISGFSQQPDHIARIHAKLVTRFELATGGLQNRCSTPELHQHLEIV